MKTLQWMASSCSSYWLSWVHLGTWTHLTVERQGYWGKPECFIHTHWHFNINHQELNYRGLHKLPSFNFPFFTLILHLNPYQALVFSNTWLKKNYWKIIALQYCAGFCYGSGGLVDKSCPTLAILWTVAHQATWSSHNYLTF